MIRSAWLHSGSTCAGQSPLVINAVQFLSKRQHVCGPCTFAARQLHGTKPSHQRNSTVPARTVEVPCYVELVQHCARCGNSTPVPQSMIVCGSEAIPNCAEVVFVVGVARRSATTAAMMFVAAVWDVALRFVSTATGIKPNTAIKQKAAIPRASVTSTRENAVPRTQIERFMVDKSSHYPLRR